MGTSTSKKNDNTGEIVNNLTIEEAAVGAPCGSHGPYTFYKGLKIVPLLTRAILEVKDSTNADSISDLPNKNLQTWSIALTETTKEEFKCKIGTRKNTLDKPSDMNSTSIQDGLTKPLVLSLGDCIPVRPWSDSPLTCLAEIRMIWRDKNEQRLLTGLRLYFLPENTPMGRNCHGEHEVVAISDKVVVRAEDFLKWFDEKVQWTWGMIVPEDQYPKMEKGLCQTKENMDGNKTEGNQLSAKYTSLKNSRIDFSEVEGIKFSGENSCSKVSVLSYSHYCRYRATLKRLENLEDQHVKKSLVQALCGISMERKDTRVMFCKDTFDYPELETHEQLCNHLAPKLKGRPRGKKTGGRSQSPFCFDKRNESYSDSNESDTSIISNQQEARKITQCLPHLRFNHRPARSQMQAKIEYKKFEIKKEEESHGETESDCDENENMRIKTLPSKKCGSKTKIFLNPAKKKSRKFSSNQSLSTNEFNIREEKFFLRKLHEFHIKHNNYIPKMIWFSLKGVCLYAIFCQVKKLGGFDSVTLKRQWKTLFGKKSGPHNTITRRKYERILLPLERSELVTRKQITTGVEKKTLRLKPEKPSSLDELKITIKRDNKCKTELSKEQMTEIQNKVRSKISLNSNLDMRHCATSSTSLRARPDSSVSMPVMVIVGSEENGCAATNAGDNSKESNPSVDSYKTRTSTLNSSSQKIQIQQPHTTITVHQTTIHPQKHSKHTSAQSQITSQIQITNQIQIQQITVQPNGDNQQGRSKSSEFRCNIKQDGIGQEIQIERDTNYAGRASCDDSLTLQNFRVKTEPKSFEKENIPFIGCGTTITPVLTFPLSPSKKSSDVIELLDSDGESEFPLRKENIPVKLQITKTNPCKENVLMPPVKKRKLDILREGGLEVTAISNTHGIICSSPPISPVSLRIPFPNSKEASQKCKNGSQKFNLPGATSLTISNINAVQNNSTKIRTNSIYSATGKIFGNPKEILPPPSSRSKLDGILDLTTRSQQTFASSYTHSNFLKHEILSPKADIQECVAMNLSSRKSDFHDTGLQITLLPPQQQIAHTNQQNIDSHKLKKKISNSLLRADLPEISYISNWKQLPNAKCSSRERKKSSSVEIHQELKTPKTNMQISTDSSITQPGQTALTNFFASKNLRLPFPTFISPISSNAPNPFLSLFNPVLLSNLYSQNPNVFHVNQHSQ